MVTIEFMKVKATLRDGEWSCADPAVRRVLTSLLELPEHQVHGGHPWPDKGIADSIVARFPGSRVVEATPDGPPDNDEPAAF